MQDSTSSPAPCLAVLGPTGSGKSYVAEILAERVGGEIVSCDSMQVYRGLDIGTAKPYHPIRERMPHHLIDIADISERYTVDRFLSDAQQAISAIWNRGRTPILCGGTGMYAKALISGFSLQPADPDTARQVEQDYNKPDGDRRLREELARYDPELASSLENPRHLKRSVEIARLTGQSPNASATLAEPRMNVDQYVLWPHRVSHRCWLQRRTAKMLRQGWIEEVRSLLEHGFLHTPTGRQALGYRTIANFLLTGKGTTKELERNLFYETWKYVRRQHTWFRNKHAEATFIQVDDQTDWEKLVQQFVHATNKSGCGEQGFF